MKVNPSYSPCKDCAERKEGCHGNCPKYRAFVLITKRDNAIRRK